MIGQELALAVLEAVDDAVVLIDEAGRVQGLNPAAERIFGWEAAELLGRDVSVLMPSPWRDEHGTYLRAYLEGGPSRVIGRSREVQGLSRYGARLELELRVTEVWDADSRLFAGILRDISARKRREEELRLGHERTQRLLDLAGALIVVCDIDGRVTWVNERCLQATGQRREDLIGEDWFGRCVPLENRDWSRLHFDRLVQAPGTEETRHEGKVLGAKDEPLTVLWRSALLRDPSGRASEVVSYGANLTGHASLEDALLEASREAENASQAKSTFLANMSHELRTPLNAVLGFSELLQQDFKQGPPTSAHMKYLKAIEESGQQLLHLVNDVLDVSKIDAGRLTLNREWIGIQDLVSSALLVHRPLAAARELSLGSVVEASLEQAFVDPLRLRQVLDNLVSNAIKFTEPGGRVEVRVDPSPGGIRIAVSDTGVGISPEHLPRLFQQFEQLGSRITPGGGLGLVLARRLVELHGGSLEVESELGVGSTFRATIPNAAPERPSSGMLLRDEVDVLVFEACDALASLLGAHFNALGLSVQRGPKAGGRGAYARERRPRLITIDLHRPDADWGLVGELRASEETAQVPVVAIADRRLEPPNERSRPDGYLIKPVDRAACQAALQSAGVDYCALEGARLGLSGAPGRLSDRICAALVRAGCRVWRAEDAAPEAGSIEGWIVLPRASEGGDPSKALSGRRVLLTEKLEEGRSPLQIEISQLEALRPEVLIKAVHELLSLAAGFPQVLRTQRARHPDQPLLIACADFEAPPDPEQVAELLARLRARYREEDFAGLVGQRRVAIGLPAGSLLAAERAREVFRAQGLEEHSFKLLKTPADGRSAVELLRKLWESPAQAGAVLQAQSPGAPRE